MFNLLCAVWEWLAESADVLLDLAVTGREAHNVFVIAVVSGLAIVRVAALLLFVVPAICWLVNFLIIRDKRGEILRVRVWAIVLIVASIIFEIWAVPGRKGDVDAETPVETRIVIERG